MKPGAGEPPSEWKKPCMASEVRQAAAEVAVVAITAAATSAEQIEVVNAQIPRNKAQHLRRV
jgi:hypothetical protein